MQTFNVVRSCTLFEYSDIDKKPLKGLKVNDKVTYLGERVDHPADHLGPARSLYKVRRWGVVGWVLSYCVREVVTGAIPNPAPTPVPPAGVDLTPRLPRPIGNAARYVKYGMTSGAVSRALTPVNVFGHTVGVHRKVAPVMKAWVDVTRRYETAHGLKPFSPKVVECFCWRMMRSGSSRSMHSWAIAVDIDPDQNGQGSKHTTIPDYVRQCARAAGIKPGYDWSLPTTDPMHFEYQG